MIPISTRDQTVWWLIRLIANFVAEDRQGNDLLIKKLVAIRISEQ